MNCELMRIVAYQYCDPLLDSLIGSSIWGLEVDRVYQDLGKRQEWEQLLADCQAAPTDYLLIRHLEELGTIEEVNKRLTQIEALGVEVIAIEQSYQTSQLKTAEPVELRTQLSELLSAVGQSDRRRRLRQGHARNRLKTLPPPGKAPYGYRRGKERYILDRSTAPVVKDFFERFLLFGSLRGAVRYLERRYGKKISVTTGRRWLSNPVYRGDLAYKNGEIISDTHVSIISREEAAQVDRLLRRNSSLPARTASAPRSLAGLVICQQCQSPMTITRVMTKDKQEYLYLRPTRCSLQPKCRAIAYQQVLQQTINHICEDLPQAVAQLDMPSMEGIKQTLVAQIDKREEILAQLPALKEQDILDSETADLRTYKLRTEISELRSRLAQLPPVNLVAIAQAVSIRQFWLDLSEAERRFYFREFIQRIELIRLQPKEWQLQLVFIF